MCWRHNFTFNIFHFCVCERYIETFPNGNSLITSSSFSFSFSFHFILFSHTYFLYFWLFLLHHLIFLGCRCCCCWYLGEEMNSFLSVLRCIFYCAGIERDIGMGKIMNKLQYLIYNHFNFRLNLHFLHCITEYHFVCSA